MEPNRRGARVLTRLDRDRVSHHFGLRAHVCVRLGDERVTKDPERAALGERN